MSYYLAVDLGASSGRHVLASINDNKIEYEEIHRFKNDFVTKAASYGSVYCWDIDYLFGEIKKGMKLCASAGKTPSYVAIDTWGVDYVLLDKNGKLTGNSVSYRDNRTKGIAEKVFEFFPEDELYNITGIQRQPFNTIFQLYAQKLITPAEVENAHTLLMLPCYFNYLLTGLKVNEYTSASTSGMLNAASSDWDREIIEKLGFERGLFAEVKPAGTILGSFTDEIAREIGYSATVVLTAAHDTASAVLASPLTESSIYLSSGTWSLMGVETPVPITTKEGMVNNFTNEGGFGGRFRLLRNIMGLWMLRSVKKEFGDRHTYDMMSFMAKDNQDFPSIVDVSDNRFLAPASMIDEIGDACADADMPVPRSVGEICSVIYHSLAHYYGKTAADLESLTDKKYDTINIVGGGTRDSYLNSLTAKACGKRVLVGPTEATALGNISAQMLATGELAGVEQAREIIRNSVTLGEYGYGVL
jgi:rhamnulokinase